MLKTATYVLALSATLAACGGSNNASAEPAPSLQLQIPESMRVEHAEIHGALTEATKEPGRVGEAARELAKVLHPHFVREEQIALPPLALLRPLASGAPVSEMRGVLQMTDALRAELPRRLREHQAVSSPCPSANCPPEKSV